MRLWVVSDLHLESRSLAYRGGSTAIPNADVCVIAGDVMNGVASAVHWLGRTIAPHMPVIFVPGNHEFYTESVLEGLEWGRVAVAATPGVHLLDNDALILDGVRFLGATLWTDLRLGARNNHDAAWNAATAEDQLSDFRQIAWRRLPAYEAFTASRAQQLHKRSRAFLQRELSIRFDGPTVVVTHHAPHPMSVHLRYESQALNSAFASDMADVIVAGRPELWVHGHTHDNADYVVGETRVLCNPGGYHSENPHFNPRLVVEVAVQAAAVSCPRCGTAFHDPQLSCPVCGAHA
ncbi:MAG: metallophosphoesterase [Alphaproteobacteria bacterium]|nr:metallophosphoesterase [Alphaproteobacteria bacterium]